MANSVIGRVFANYRIERELGRGGMGVVYEATDLNLSARRALKVISPALLKNPLFHDRLRKEARALANVNSPYVVQAHALVEIELGTCLVMEYVEGDLSDMLRSAGPEGLPLDYVKELLTQVLLGLKAAHKSSLIHRDIKPSNILLSEDGVAKLTDFGLARQYRADSADETITAFGAGTLHYMSPEQVKGSKDLDPRTDLYSVGMTAYVLVTGRVPFHSDQSYYGVMESIVRGKIPPPSTYRPDLPRQFERFITKAISPKPERRFQTVDEMLASLERIEIDAGGTPAPEPQSGRSRRRLVVLMASVAAVVAMIVFFATRSSNETEVVTPPPPGFGTIIVGSEPDSAFVLVDGKLVPDVTPLTLDSIPAGFHTLEVQRAGYVSYRGSVRVLADSVVRSNQTLDEEPPGSGYLAITTTPPNAQVDVFDTETDSLVTSDVSPFDLAVLPGRYRLRFRHPTGEYRDAVRNTAVIEGDTLRLNLPFKRAVQLVELTLDTSPAGARLILNEKYVGDSGTPFRVRVREGRHSLRAERAGQSARDTSFAVGDERKTLLWHIQPDGQLRIWVKPAGEVYLDCPAVATFCPPATLIQRDNLSLEQTTSVAPGQHTVRVVVKGEKWGDCIARAMMIPPGGSDYQFINFDERVDVEVSAIDSDGNNVDGFVKINGRDAGLTPGPYSLVSGCLYSISVSTDRGTRSRQHFSTPTTNSVVLEID